MNKSALAALALASIVATPALAALDVGATAPDFTASGFLAGKAFTFNLDEALKKGPVVLYFFPAVHTGGCNLEAHLFAEKADQFKKDGATLIGVTAGNLDQLQIFSNETQYCSGKFPVAADVDLKIAKNYKATLFVRPGWTDRTSYVITPNHKIAFVYSNLDAGKHVDLTLDALKKWKAEHHA